MEQLMYEAADEILPNRRNEQLLDEAGITKLRSNTRKSTSFMAEEDEISSVEMLRKTILRSIQTRQTKLNLYEDLKRAKLEEFGPPSPKIEVKSFDEKLKFSSIHTSTKNKDPVSNETISASSDDLDSRLTPDITHQSQLQNLFTHLKNKITNQEPKTNELKESVLIESKKKEIVENSLKLARRTSTENIFENCSTYNMVYPEIILPRKSPPERFPSLSSLSSKAPYPETTESNENHDAVDGLTERSNSNGDPVNLNDTIFTHIINGDYISSTESSKSGRNNPTRCLEADESFAEGSSISTYSHSFQTSTAGMSAELHCRNGNSSGKTHHKNRRKNKKNKSKDPPVFDCSKCGVSYHITSGKAMDMARCLHCDYWTTVEPVFLKREKQTWNTCSIS